MTAINPGPIKRNLERKFRCPDLPAAEKAAQALGAVFAGTLVQRDLFFPAPRARLKLRILGEGPAELISYVRPDQSAARLSHYTLTPVVNAPAMIATLTHSLGNPRELHKTRRLYLHRVTRIHLDTVANLGTFVELETVITTQSPAEAESELSAIASALRLTDSVPTAYVDLLP
jgi:adenylate cyclase, class 2